MIREALQKGGLRPGFEQRLAAIYGLSRRRVETIVLYVIDSEERRA